MSDDHELDPELVRRYAREMCARFGYAAASWQQHAEFVRRVMRAALDARPAGERNLTEKDAEAPSPFS